MLYNIKRAPFFDEGGPLVMKKYLLRFYIFGVTRATAALVTSTAGGVGVSSYYRSRVEEVCGAFAVRVDGLLELLFAGVPFLEGCVAQYYERRRNPYARRCGTAETYCVAEDRVSAFGHTKQKSSVCRNHGNFSVTIYEHLCGACYL